MNDTRVEVLPGEAIRVSAPALFAKAQNRGRFLARSFEVEEVRSVEIDASGGVALLRLKATVATVGDILRKLADRLAAPPPPGVPAGNGYFQLPGANGRLVYARAPGEIAGPRRPLYRALGGFFVGMSLLGIISPFIPTTPFVLLSGYFFLRSSARLHDRLTKARVFGPILHDFYVHGGLRLSIKRNTLLFMAAMLLAGAAATGFAPGAVAAMGLVSLVSFTLLLALPTVRERDRRALATPGRGEGSPGTDAGT